MADDENSVKKVSTIVLRLPEIMSAEACQIS